MLLNWIPYVKFNCNQKLTFWYLDSSSKVDLLQPRQGGLLQRSPLHLAESQQRGVCQPHAPPTAVCPATAALHITRDVIIPHTYTPIKRLFIFNMMQLTHKKKCSRKHSKIFEPVDTFILKHYDDKWQLTTGNRLKTKRQKSKRHNKHTFCRRKLTEERMSNTTRIDNIVTWTNSAAGCQWVI